MEFNCIFHYFTKNCLLSPHLLVHRGTIDVLCFTSACFTCLQALIGETPVSRIFLLHFLLIQLLSGRKEPCMSTKYFLCLHVMLSTRVLLKAAKIIQKLMSIQASLRKRFERTCITSNIKTKPWMSPCLLCMPIHLLLTNFGVFIRYRRSEISLAREFRLLIN